MKKIFLTSATLFTLLAPMVSAASYSTKSTYSTYSYGDALAGFGFLSAYFGIYFVCICSFFAIQIAIAVWVYRDAQKRTLDNPVMWLLVTLVGGIIGLIVYLIVRSDKPVIKQPTNPVSVNN